MTTRRCLSLHPRDEEPWSHSLTEVHSPSSAGSGAQQRTVRVEDVVESSLLLVLGLIGFAILAFVSLFLATASDGCGSGTNCDLGMMAAGYFIALLVPTALAFWGVGAAIIQVSLGR